MVPQTDPRLKLMEASARMAQSDTSQPALDIVIQNIETAHFHFHFHATAAPAHNPDAETTQ